MKYQTGQDVKLGDIVLVGSDCEAVIVADISDDLFSDAYPQAEWQYLSEGVLLFSSQLGLLHYSTLIRDIQWLRRAEESADAD